MQDAVLTLAGKWKERFEYAKSAKSDEEFTPPVMIPFVNLPDHLEVQVLDPIRVQIKMFSCSLTLPGPLARCAGSPL